MSGHRERTRRHLILFALSAASLGGCSTEQIFDLLTAGVATCFEEGGCTGEANGTPLSQWAPPDLFVVSELTARSDSPMLSISLTPRELPPFCPDVGGDIAATVDGHSLAPAPRPSSAACDGLSWQLTADAWPEAHSAASVVEISDGEGALVLNAPFSLTLPPAPSLATTVLMPGELVDIDVALPRSEEELIGPATVQVDKEAAVNAEVVTIDDDLVRLRLPAELEAGPATLRLPYQVHTVAGCADAEICRASVYGELRLSVEIAGP